MITSIIVDDELKSRESLKILLEDFCENVTVKALCQNIAEAIEAIQENKPDVVFLDIQLQRETGFDLLTRLPEIDFEVIFTTAYSEYAIKAFRFSAIDYLLKPIDIEELKRALTKVEKRKGDTIATRLQQLMQNLRTGSTDNYKLTLPTSDGLLFVKIQDILYCEASSNYTEITFADGKKCIVSRTLKEYEDLLADHNFYRIHNSYLINLNAIKKYVRGEGGYVIMNNDKSLDVSKRKKEGFLSRIGTKL
ncbi:LytR/AlgR family response regulator transcription factor [Dawidia soli]|uniref:LytTR family DNA-binding domain-containing protein n=1 Tax=Dawidia soli TaxID=2782352 RepID=A0AAP2GGP4_9BACT|nr:LytTR family DNA-binding domain-containing protein [Dawidia soli]MBT1686346.1 LytTR family DNA-binding domain-containing protein [Dawidia soli]